MDDLSEMVNDVDMVFFLVMDTSHDDNGKFI